METPPERRSPTPDGPEAVFCDHCGHAIGVYEPLIVAEHGHLRETSRAAETLPVNKAPRKANPAPLEQPL